MRVRLQRHINIVGSISEKISRPGNAPPPIPVSVEVDFFRRDFSGGIETNSHFCILAL